MLEELTGIFIIQLRTVNQEEIIMGERPSTSTSSRRKAMQDTNTYNLTVPLITLIHGASNDTSIECPLVHVSPQDEGL